MVHDRAMQCMWQCLNWVGKCSSSLPLLSSLCCSFRAAARRSGMRKGCRAEGSDLVAVAAGFVRIAWLQEVVVQEKAGSRLYMCRKNV